LIQTNSACAASDTVASRDARLHLRGAKRNASDGNALARAQSAASVQWAELPRYALAIIGAGIVNAAALFLTNSCTLAAFTGAGCSRSPRANECQ
jgi:hypothetical protein